MDVQRNSEDTRLVVSTMAAIGADLPEDVHERVLRMSKALFGYLCCAKEQFQGRDVLHCFVSISANRRTFARKRLNTSTILAMMQNVAFMSYASKKT